MAQEHKSAGDVLSDVFSQAKDGLMSFGETIANKSKEAYDSAKLNTQKAQLESENEEYYKQLGKMVKDKEEYTDEMKDISKKIDENESELQKLEAEMNGEGGKDGQQDEVKNQQSDNAGQESSSDAGNQKNEAEMKNQNESVQSSSEESNQSGSSEAQYKHKENPVTGTEKEEIKVKNSGDADSGDADSQLRNMEQGKPDYQASGTKTMNY